MITLQLLESLGYTQEFFKLSGNEGTDFTYYTFNDTPPPGMANEWNVIGIRRRLQKNHLIDVSVMHIDDDELSLEEFTPEYADNFLSLSLANLQAMIAWIEENVVPHQVSPDKEIRMRYFRQLKIDELVNLRLMPWQIQRAADTYYVYLPDEGIQDSEKLSVIHFPTRPIRYEASRRALLEFVTFDRSLLDDPEFRPFDSIKWLGYMTFNEASLREFISLLKQHISVVDKKE
ncbi:MAG: hypothetical protein ACYDER_29740 [Ktedonobacteraceae bacterium]